MIGLGAIIGAGIFVATGVAAASAGALLPLAILLAGIPAVFNGLSAAANAVALPRSGGTYLFARELISPFFGFIAGWLFIFAFIVGDTAIALGFGAYVNAAIPVLPARLAGLAFVVLVTGINYVGLAVVTEVNNLLTVMKVGVLVFFIAFGAIIVLGGTAPSVVSSRVEFGGVISAAALLFFAYPGYARVATLAEEVSDPRTTIPRAVILALGIATVLYVLTTLIAVLLAGPSALANSAAPLAAAVRVATGGWPVVVVALGGVIATSSVLVVDVAAFSRVILAMARYGDLPGWFSEVNRRFATPGRAVLAAGVTIGVLVLTGDLTALIAAGSFGPLLYYAITNVAALRLQPSDRPPIIVPILGAASCLALSLFLPSSTIVVGLLIVGAGALAYGLRVLLARRVRR